MKHVMNFPLFDGCLKEFGSMAEAARDCASAGLDGLEVIWDHMPYTEEMPPAGLAVGYHMLFWSNWVDFWKGDRDALMREFGSWELVREYYHGDDRAAMLDGWRRDLGHARDVGAEYLVFHVSEVTLRECFTYDFAYTDEEVVDAAAEVINELTSELDGSVAFLVENQWWPGLTFTRPEMTRRLMDAIEYPNKGIMLDTGHLMSTNTRLRTQAEGARYISEMLDAHGDLARMVRGLHLHQSLSGEYVEGNAYQVSDEFEAAPGYWEKYAATYKHVVQIDRHQPWTDPAIASVIERIAPEWVNHELSAWGRGPHLEAVRTQMQTLGL